MCKWGQKLNEYLVSLAEGKKKNKKKEEEEEEEEDFTRR